MKSTSFRLFAEQVALREFIEIDDVEFCVRSIINH